MTKKHLFVCLCAIALAFTSTAQQAEKMPTTDHIEGEILFQLADNQSVEAFEKIASDSLLAIYGFCHSYLIEPVAPNLRIYSLQVYDRGRTDEHLLRAIKSIPSVSAAQFNHKITLRGNPNDPLFQQQWNLAKVNAPSVWDVTTGGLTACGDTIVVAVIDAGFKADLPELVDNIWKNKAEIPNNGIDDDKNGYIDDYQGLNTFGLNDNHTTNFDDNSIIHGTACAGIVGASSNNNKLLAGVNWKIKLMLLSGIRRSNQAGILRAYDYVLQQRRLYDSTGGKKGAFIPVTSMSAGFTGQTPSDMPLLCAVYSELEKLGILNFVATTNTFEDVLTSRDMPAQCDKPSLVVVTGTDKDDIKKEYGFSSKYVHLAAPATRVLVLTTDNDAIIDSGTSFATPLVAGAAALLWSMPETGLCQLSKTKPVEAMNLVKKAILNGVNKLPTLANKTVTGGRLNIQQSFNLLRRTFGQPIGDFDIVQLFPNPVVTKLNVVFQLPENTIPDVLITNTLGQVVYQKKMEAKDLSAPFFTIDTRNFAAGLYVISMRTVGFDVSKKFVVVQK